MPFLLAATSTVERRSEAVRATADGVSKQRLADGPAIRNEAPNLRPGVSVSWRTMAFFIWISGVCCLAAHLVWCNARFSYRIGRSGIDASRPAWLLLEDCRRKLGLSQRVLLVETCEVQSPSVHGLLMKCLLIPKGMLDRFNSEELRCVFLHELAHIKRCDLEINWLVSTLLVVHWFNPLLWLAFARMRHDRELACDAMALTNLGVDFNQPYGETILKVVGNLTHARRAPGVLALSEDRKRLKDRIRMIAAFRQCPRWSTLAVVLAIGIAASGLTNAGRARTSSEAADQDKASVSAPKVQSKGIHVRVMDSRGNPVTNASVVAQGFDWRTTTDSEGRFSWTEAGEAPGFQVWGIGYRPLVTRLAPPGGKEIILCLQETPVVWGKVIDKNIRKSIPQFEVHHVRLLQGPVMPSLLPHEVGKGNAGFFVYSFPVAIWPDSALLVDAEGYSPALSRRLGPDDEHKELEFELTRSQPIAGTVLTPEGAVAGKAEVRLWCGEPNISDIPTWRKIESDRDGRFSAGPILDGRVLVFHDSGYAETAWKDFVATRRVQLSAWGHVKGHWPKPVPRKSRISLESMDWAGGMNLCTFPPPWTVDTVQVDPDGNFEFKEGAPPGEYMLTTWNSLTLEQPGGGFSMAVLISKRLPVVVEAGRTTFVEMPVGRSVVGQVDLGDRRNLVHVPIINLRLKQKGPAFDFPAPDPALSNEENFNRWKDYRERAVDYWLSEEGKARRREERVLEVPAETDGKFRIDHVPPGSYELHVNTQRWGPKQGPEIRSEITVELSADGSPMDLGVLR